MGARPVAEPNVFASLAVAGAPRHFGRRAIGISIGLLVAQIALGFSGRLSWIVASILIAAVAAVAALAVADGRRSERTRLARGFGRSARPRAPREASVWSGIRSDG